MHRNLRYHSNFKPERQNMRKNKENSAPKDDTFDLETEDGLPSKTQVKNAMLALQTLGEQLITLKKNELLSLLLPENLIDAILEAKKLTHWGAIKRQKQYIGRLMRDIDPAPIQTYFDRINNVSHTHTAWLHRLEKLRESLLNEDQALQKLLEAYPQTNIQALRTLIRNARKEREENKPPKYFRELFQMLKEIIPEPEIPPVTSSHGLSAGSIDE